MDTEPSQPFLATWKRDVNVIGNFVFEFNLITFTSRVHLIKFSNLICNHLPEDGTLLKPLMLPRRKTCSGLSTPHLSKRQILIFLTFVEIGSGHLQGDMP